MPSLSQCLIAMGLAFAATLANAAEVPSFDCAKASHQAEEVVCKDLELTKLDQELARLYKLASVDPAARKDASFKATQIGWIKGRNDCWKSADIRRCVRDEYATRIADLRRSYPKARSEVGEGISKGPFILECPGVKGLLTVTKVGYQESLEVLGLKGQHIVLVWSEKTSDPRTVGDHMIGTTWDDQPYELWDKADRYRLKLPGGEPEACNNINDIP